MSKICDMCNEPAKWKFTSRVNIIHFWCSEICALEFFGTRDMLVAAASDLEELK